MKEKMLLFAAMIAAALLLAGCQDDISVPTDGSVSKVFTASIEQEFTKATLTSDFKTEWNAYDQIKINGVWYEATPLADATQATFTCLESDEAKAPYYATFPTDLQMGAGYLYFPSVQHFRGSFNTAMYAESNTTSLVFHNICGVLDFALKGTAKVRSIEVQANEPICGRSEMLDPVTVNLTGNGTKVTLECDWDIEMKEDEPTHFYIYLPPGNYSKGLKVSVFDSDGNVFIQTTTKDITIERNNLYRFDWAPKFERVVPLIPISELVIQPGEGGRFDVEYSSAASLSVQTSEDWLRYEGQGDGFLKFSTDYNYCPERKATVTLTDQATKAAPVSFEVIQDESNFRKGLMMIYNAMGKGANWDYSASGGIYAEGLRRWGTDAPFNTWQGVEGLPAFFRIYFVKERGHNLEGELPDCFDLFGDELYEFQLTEQDGITGTLPPSFASLTRLQGLLCMGSSMTSLPDLFADMKDLRTVSFCHNFSMTGPLPEHLAQNDDMDQLWLNANDFTGDVPESYLKHASKKHARSEEMLLNLRGNRLSGKYPDFGEDNFRNSLNFVQQKGYGFDMTGRPMKAFNLSITPKDVITGKDVIVTDVAKANKYTVVIHWTTWCPFAVTLMPRLSKLYDKYHKDGLEVIAFATMMGQDGPDRLTTIREKGYDKWINLDSDNMVYAHDESLYYNQFSPFATVIDQDNNVVFSCVGNGAGVIDPVEHRFGYAASVDLIPFLESVFGPADEEVYSSTDYSQDGKVTTIQTATVGNGINVVFMGDGYSDREMNDEVYGKAMRAAADEFFAIEPYKSFKNRFNVYYVNVVSKNEKCGDGYETALGTTFGSGTHVEGNLDKCYEYALKVPGITSRNNLLVPVMVKTSRHAGTAHMSESTQSSVAFFANGDNDPELFGSTLRHEAGGHGFGFLDDEYVTSYSEIPQDRKNSRISMWQQYGWFANVDFTNDPTQIKWAKFLTDDRYKNDVGIYQGGSTYGYGVYKPTENSMMNENMEYFNAPSREAIYKRIVTLSGEGYTYDKFLEYDAVNRTPGAVGVIRAPQKAHARGDGWQPGAPPVIHP